MKKDRLYWWCDQAWLHVIYLIGIVMSCILVLNWNGFSTPAKLMCGLAILVPLHVFEENTLPGGFFFMNNLGAKSVNPRMYPQNMVTNMVTNMGAEIVFIILTFTANHLSISTAIIVIFFGIMECLHHTMNSVQVFNRYKSKGKKTLYGPGLITSYVGLLQLSMLGICWLRTQTVSASEVVVGIAIILGIAICLILIPFAISIRIKSERFAFTDIGYFKKYE